MSQPKLCLHAGFRANRNHLVALTCLTLMTLASPVAVMAQDDGESEGASEKRQLEHEDYDRWMQLRSPTLSTDGRVAMYSLAPLDGDTKVIIKMLETGQEFTIERANNPRLSYDGTHVFYMVPPTEESIEEARKARTPPENMPKSKFECLDLTDGSTFAIERARSYTTPEKAGGWVAIHLENPPSESNATETEQASEGESGEGQEGSSPRPPRPPQGEGAAGDEDDADEKKKDPGTMFVVRNLTTDVEIRFPNVLASRFSEDGGKLAWSASSEEPAEDGVFVLNLPSLEPVQIISGLGNYSSLNFDEAGRQLVFVTNRDDYEAKEPKRSIYLWLTGRPEASMVVNWETRGIPEGWEVSGSGIRFSKNGRRLFLNTAPIKEPEPEEDPDADDEDEVKVDIWHWQDPLLQPMQLRQIAAEQNRSYMGMYDIASSSYRQLADAEVPSVTVADEGNSDVALGTSSLPYRMLISWDSPGYSDLYLYDLRSGEREMVLQGVQSRGALSPKGRYLTWWDTETLSWMGMSTSAREAVNLSASIPYPVHNELHDSPSPARSYGAAGWVENDRQILIYDKFDIWEVDPNGRRAPRCITEGQGREQQIRFRYQRTDPEEQSIAPADPLLLSAFHVWNKSSGYYRDQVTGNDPPQPLIMLDEAIRVVSKAQDADAVLVTRSTFEKYPDAWITNLQFEEMEQLSNANPQQTEYSWGTAELIDWTSLDGEVLQGILYKPDGFDPSQEYPMLVYFYERNSDSLHRYVTPAPARASINYSFYVSRGYVVFVPDIPYRIGHPGQSCLNAVIPGVTSLVDAGFVDRDAIGVQGHSWGGYQIAYLVTRCHLFAAAEAGAPVSNMTSAYGGIRWSSGMSRMFQYEQTQSRIGGTLWDQQQKYIENSPVFQADQVETPLLMLHNDQDGAVPWYQGIEMFVALRRLSKPTWLFNYNGEDHGLRQLQNQRDWSVRMQQYFDHYCKGAPAPRWLSEGVPAVEKGKTLGLELPEAAESPGQQ